MSALASRLRTLRAQAGVVAPAIERPDRVEVARSSACRHLLPRGEEIQAGGSVAVGEVAQEVRRPASGAIRDLRRLLGLRDRIAAPRVVQAAAFDRTLPGREISPGLRLVEHRYAWPDIPDGVTWPDRLEPPIAAGQFLAFDTETTGLAGGTGTRAFMIGAADWIDGSVRVRQLCITTLAAEIPMLRVFATWLRPDTVLVSYNGRSYDAPLLRTRCRLARLPDMLAELQHLDLLHPTRRRYRGVWENCRLATIERNLLEIVREDDLPGSQAPGAWLQYLRGGDGELLRRVHAHNLQDVRTLLALLVRIGGVRERAA